MTSPEPTNPSELFTPFIPSTFNIPESGDRLNSYLGEEFSNFADVINDKKIGNYTQQAENFNGEKWIYRTPQIIRSGYQVISYIPSYPATGVLILTVNTIPAYPLLTVNPELVVTQVWGSASRPCSAAGAGDGDYFSFFGEGNSKISFTLSDTTITITTTQDMTAYSGFIVMQYLRNGL